MIRDKITELLEVKFFLENYFVINWNNLTEKKYKIYHTMYKKEDHDIIQKTSTLSKPLYRWSPIIL